jgi:hypothetical protein
LRSRLRRVHHFDDFQYLILSSFIARTPHCLDEIGITRLCAFVLRARLLRFGVLLVAFDVDQRAPRSLAAWWPLQQENRAMDTVQLHNKPKAAGEILPSVQAAFENWSRLNTKLTQMFFDASIAHVNRVQEFMRLPAASVAANGAGEPQKLWHAQVDELKRQMEESIGMSRQIADQTRQTLFEMASTMLQVPVAAQAQLAETLTGGAEKRAAR